MRQAGFTLIEVVIAATILAAILLTATLSFSFFSDRWIRTSDYLENERKRALGLTYIHKVLAGTQDYFIDDNGAKGILFQGADKELVGVSSYSASGREDHVLFRLSIRDADATQEPRLHYQEWGLSGKNLYTMTALSQLLSSEEDFAFDVQPKMRSMRFFYLGVSRFEDFLFSGNSTQASDVYHAKLQWQGQYDAMQIKVLPRRISLASVGDTPSAITFDVPYLNEYKMGYIFAK